jgi:phage/plasmid-like protein (TIGR03299 family)
MAHEVETMAYNKERGMPWHGLGVANAGLTTSAEMIVSAGLDWKVKQQPIFTEHNGATIAINGKRANVRDTDGAVLGVVGDRYTPIQNDEVMSFADALLEEGARYEAAGSLRGGQIVFTALEIPEKITIQGDNGGTTTYLVVANGHNGLFPLKAMITPVRVVCMNTLNAALGSAKMSFTLRHTARLDEKVKEAKRALGIASKVVDEFSEVASRMVAEKVDRDEIFRVITQLFPLSQKEREGKEVLSERAKATIAILNNAENLDGLRDTKWGLYNAIAEYLDHGVSYRGGVRSTANDARASSVMLDTGFAAKTKREAILALV